MLMGKVFQDSSNNPEFYPVFLVYLARAYKDVVYGVGSKLVISLKHTTHLY